MKESWGSWVKERGTAVLLARREEDRASEKQSVKCGCRSVTVVFPVRNLASTVVVGANRPYLLLFSCVCVFVWWVGLFFSLAFRFLSPLSLLLFWICGWNSCAMAMTMFKVLFLTVLWFSAAPGWHQRLGFSRWRPDFCCCEVWGRALFRRGKFSGWLLKKKKKKKKKKKILWWRAKLSTREKDRNPAVDLGFTSNASRKGFRV